MGVGNPATARAPVVFDDDNLQQSYNVDALIRYTAAKNFGVFDGWMQLLVERTQNGGGYAETTLDPIDTFISTDPALYDPTDVFWLYSSSAYIVAGADAANINEASVALELPADAQFAHAGAAGHPFLWWYGEAPVKFNATTAVVHDYSGNILSPFPVPRGSTVHCMVHNNAVDNTTTTFSLIGRVLPRGVPPYPPGGGI